MGARRDAGRRGWASTNVDSAATHSGDVTMGFVWCRQRQRRVRGFGSGMRSAPSAAVLLFTVAACSGQSGGSGEPACASNEGVYLGACRTQCVAASDCADGERCRDSLCIPVACGNGYIEEGEGCDDGNRVPADGCGADCQTEPWLCCDAQGHCVGDGDNIRECEICVVDAAGIARPVYAPECPERCRASCDDEEPCTRDYCGVNGRCVYAARPAGWACDNPCLSGPGTCSESGECTGDMLPSGTPCADAPSECTYGGTCDTAGHCIRNQHLPFGSPCGDPRSSECDLPDSCDGAGTCNQNFSSGACATHELCRELSWCNGAGACDLGALLPAGSPCGPPSSNPCLDVNRCDGNGYCAVSYLPTGTACGPESECRAVDVCWGGICTEGAPFAAGTPCGDPNAMDCTAADTCDGSGTCLANDAVDGTPCDDCSTPPCDSGGCAAARCRSCDGTTDSRPCATSADCLSCDAGPCAPAACHADEQFACEPYDDWAVDDVPCVSAVCGNGGFSNPTFSGAVGAQCSLVGGHGYTLSASYTFDTQGVADDYYIWMHNAADTD